MFGLERLDLYIENKSGLFLGIVLVRKAWKIFAPVFTTKYINLFANTQ